MLLPEALVQKYNQPVPRYTSYPPATAFHTGVDAELYLQWLKHIPEKSLLSAPFVQI